jgi:hypothetical protein
MASTTDHDLRTQAQSVSPERSRHEQTRPPSTLRRRALYWLGWAALVAAVTVAAGLAFVTFTGGDDPDTTSVPAHASVVEHGSIRSIEGSVEDTVPAPDASATDPTTTSGHSSLVEHGSIRSIEGTVEDSLPD